MQDIQKTAVFFVSKSVRAKGVDFRAFSHRFFSAAKPLSPPFSWRGKSRLEYLCAGRSHSAQECDKMSIRSSSITLFCSLLARTRYKERNNIYGCDCCCPALLHNPYTLLHHTYSYYYIYYYMCPFFGVCCHGFCGLQYRFLCRRCTFSGCFGTDLK